MILENIERYLYSWSLADRLRNYRMQRQLNVTYFSGVTAIDKKISMEQMPDFYGKSLDVLFHYKIEEKVKKIIAHAVCQFYSGASTDERELRLAEENLKNINAKDLPMPNWLALSAFFMSNGFFYLSFIAREKYKERLLSTKGRVYRWERIQVYLENGDIVLAQKEIKKIEHSLGMKRAYSIGISTAKRFIQIVTEPQENIKNNRDMRFEDKEFYDFLKNRKIVIEGPVQEIQTTDFDDSAVYVRNNDFLNRSEKMTDITYLNYYAYKLCKMNPEEHKNKWNFICLKKADKDFRPSPHIRVSRNPKEIFLRGHPNMLPLMLYDLAGEDIYVTGNNLFISAEIHTKEYDRGMNIDEKDTNVELCRDLGQHDVISQYFFLKNMHSAKLFEADRQLTYVMNLGAGKYCQIMDKIHGISCWVQKHDCK